MRTGVSSVCVQMLIFPSSYYYHTRQTKINRSGCIYRREANSRISGGGGREKASNKAARERSSVDLLASTRLLLATSYCLATSY